MNAYPAATVFCPACDFRLQAVSHCFAAHCAWAWQRQGFEDRARAAERDQREAEAKG